MAEKVDIAIFGAPSHSPFIDYREIDRMAFPQVASSELVGSELDLVGKSDLGRHPQVVVKSSDEKAPDTGLVNEAPKWIVADMSTKKDLILAGLR